MKLTYYERLIDEDEAIPCPSDVWPYRRLFGPWPHDDRFSDYLWDTFGVRSGTGFHFYEVRHGDVPVARIEIHDDDPTECYSNPLPTKPILEIQNIEVASSHRGCGLGTLIVEEIARAHTERTLAALSEQADEFWSSLGWIRYERSDDRPNSRPLYVQNKP